jgi:hypothetical protein
MIKVSPETDDSIKSKIISVYERFLIYYSEPNQVNGDKLSLDVNHMLLMSDEMPIIKTLKLFPKENQDIEIFSMIKMQCNSFRKQSEKNQKDHSANRSQKEASHPENCLICLESFKSHGEDQNMLACNHKFHVKCVTKWFSKDSRCPICRCYFRIDLFCQIIEFLNLKSFNCK